MRIGQVTGCVKSLCRSFQKKTDKMNNVSLIGQKIKVKPSVMDEFKSIYLDLDPDDIFTVTEASRLEVKGKYSPAKTIDFITFVNSSGIKAKSTASRFNLVSMLLKLK